LGDFGKISGYFWQAPLDEKQKVGYIESIAQKKEPVFVGSKGRIL
jgi:hypothetical protein